MEILAHSQKNYTPAKNSWEDEEIKINFKFIIALEHIGANEQWSFWSTAHMEDCSLGLLHSFLVLLFLLSSECWWWAEQEWMELLYFWKKWGSVSLFMWLICSLQLKLCISFGSANEWPLFSDNLCWQLAIRYKRRGSWRSILQGLIQMLYFAVFNWC